ncbi:MAG: hypothetical protein QMD36_03440 [Candidatus Aenigmarchaeota archaeon]|nr:hypothetical protein [Candidatus Aenigmarchaeota archaeon]
MRLKHFILLFLILSMTTVTSQNVAIITFSMPRSYDVYQDGDNTFMITVKNEGFVTLHNVTVLLSGITEDSYSIQPSSVDTLEIGQSTHFSVSMDPKKINPGVYSLSVTMKSDETSELVMMTLNVKETTREIGEMIKRHEEAKRALETMKNTLIGIMVLSGFILIITGIRFFFKSSYLKEKNKCDKGLIEYED